jgi:phosphopantothenoylcysteine synthetase/decarboxylase
MNETMSLVLATAILAFGGFGLYMYKNTISDENVEYNEDNLFGGKKEKKIKKNKKKNEEDNENKWDYNDNDYDEDNIDENDEDDEDIDFKQKTRISNTKKSRKTTGGSSKRRY